ncbi:hypothetical protein GW17_00047747, partial [Ensete ventricosum]
LSFILEGMEASQQNAVGGGNKGRFKSICVFCGSRHGNRTSFSEAALDLGKKLVRNQSKFQLFLRLHQEHEMRQLAEAYVGILNVDGYYNDLLALFKKAVEEGFIEDSASQIVVSADNAENLIREMEERLGEKKMRETSKKRKRS